MNRPDLSRKHRAADGIRVSKAAFACCQFGISDPATAPVWGQQQRRGGLCVSGRSFSFEMGLSYTSKRAVLLDAC